MIDPVYISTTISADSFLLARVRKYVEACAQMWRQSADENQELGTAITYFQKKKRERHFKEFMNKAAYLGRQNQSFLQRPDVQDEIFLNVHQFMTNAIGMSGSQLDLLMSADFKQSTKDYVAMARQFDASLSPADMFQACRNVWIMNGLQLLFGLPVKFTPAIGAYSLLYPYTDNYLDDVTISSAEKRSFNNRFTDRLNGHYVQHENSHEKSIFALVDIIESQFNRALYPQVFDSLIAIQQAQAKSVSLIHQHDSISPRDILDISLEKGGASVLADGYLVAGELDESQELFLFGYGAYLQFLDDVQDVAEDAAIGQKTIYSMLPAEIPLDAVAQQTFVFGDKVIDLFSKPQNKNATAYLNIMRTSIRLMLIEAICFAPERFTRGYLSVVEKYSPFGFRALRRLKKKHEPYYMSMFGKVV